MRSLRSFLVPLTLLTFLHAYIGWRILPDLPAAPGWRIVAAAVLVLSLVSMPLGFMARSMQPRERADRFAAVGLFMMGFFSSLFVLTLLRDVVLLFVNLVATPEHVANAESVSALLVSGLAVFATLAGFITARRRARIVNIDIPLLNLPEALQGFSIAQISDVHVGPTIKRRYVDAIVNAVNDLKPDVIALTGDLVDGSVKDLASHTAPLGRLLARHGAYLVTGNHEYYSGERAWTAEFRRLGLNVLMNEHVVITHNGARLVLAGVADFGAHHFNPEQRSDPRLALKDAPMDAATPRILLAHQPRSAPSASAAGFDLQLSGHTHGGQFWPWNLFVRLQQPFTAGLHRLNDLWVYISRGTGYWGPPNRFGSPSEITHLRLVRAGA